MLREPTPRAQDDLRQAFYNAYSRLGDAKTGYSMTQVKSTVKKNLLHLGYPVVRRNRGLVVLGVRLPPAF